MTKDELTRVRSDLETMQSAMGLEPRTDSQEIFVNLLFAAACLAATAWALAPHGMSPLLGLGCLAIPLFAWVRGMKVQEEHQSKREIRGAFRTIWLAAPLLALFFWCRHLGFSPLQFLSLSVFLIGTVLFSAALGEKQFNSLLGWAISLMLGGLLLALELAPVVAVFTSALGVGGLISAILVFVTREESTKRGAL